METCPTDRTNKKHNEHSKEAARFPQAASLFAGSTYPAQYRHLKPSYPTAAHSSAPFFRVGQNRRRPDNDTRPVLRRLPKLEYSTGYGEHGMITKNTTAGPTSLETTMQEAWKQGKLTFRKTARQFAPCGRTEPFEKAPREAIPTAKPGLSGRRPTRERLLAKDRIFPENGPKEPGNGSAGQIPAPYPAIGPASVPTEADTGL